MAATATCDEKIDNPMTAPSAGEAADGSHGQFLEPPKQDQRPGSAGSKGSGSEQISPGPAGNGHQGGGGRKKRRGKRGTGKRRHWKPYLKLTPEERKERDRLEQERAERSRARQFAKGKPMAPYNTTQFLLEDREARNMESELSEQSAALRAASRERTYSGTGSFDSEGVGGVSSETGSTDDSYEAEFQAEFENAHLERLEGMSKDELLQGYVSLEKELAELRSMVNQLRQENAHLRGQLRNSGLIPRAASAPDTNSLASGVGGRASVATETVPLPGSSSSLQTAAPSASARPAPEGNS